MWKKNIYDCNSRDFKFFNVEEFYCPQYWPMIAREELAKDVYIIIIPRLQDIDYSLTCISKTFNLQEKIVIFKAN